MKTTWNKVVVKSVFWFEYRLFEKEVWLLSYLLFDIVWFLFRQHNGYKEAIDYDGIDWMDTSWDSFINLSVACFHLSINLLFIFDNPIYIFTSWFLKWIYLNGFIPVFLISSNTFQNKIYQWSNNQRLKYQQSWTLMSVRFSMISD